MGQFQMFRCSVYPVLLCDFTFFFKCKPTEFCLHPVLILLQFCIDCPSWKVGGKRGCERKMLYMFYDSVKRYNMNNMLHFVVK
jgi:hypothetical protein